MKSFILDSKRKDNLCECLFSTSSDFPCPLPTVCTEPARPLRNGANAAELGKLTNDLGRALLKNRKDIPSGKRKDEVVYPAAVAIHTWLEFSPYVIARIHNKDRKDKPLTFDQILALEKDYAEIRRLLEASRITDTPMMNHVLRETVAGFEGRKTN